MPDMHEKTVVVTGGNSGIGYETALALSAMGARVIVTARNADKGRTAVAALNEHVDGQAHVQLVVFDLGDLASVRRGAAEILEQAPRLDVLVNNAGLVQTLRSETVDGFETTFAVNHLGPFLLTNLLLDRLVRVEPGPDRERGLHRARLRPPRHAVRRSPIDRGATGACASTGSRSWPTSSSPSSSRAGSRVPGSRPTPCIPGRCAPATAATGTPAASSPSASRSPRPSSCSPAKGARTSIYLASSPEVDGVSGEYFVKCKPRQPKRWARDPEAAARLWRVSEELVGLPQHQEG